MENNTEKFIRTANGVKTKRDFSKNSLCLPYEHICQNLCEFVLKSNQTIDEDISLKILSDLVLNKFSHMKNLYLENDTTRCADELSLLKEYNCQLIIDSTTKKNGQNLKNLREISNLSGINVCFGYTLKEDFYNYDKDFDFEKIHNEIRYELVYGYEDLIPSFIGEIILSDSSGFPNRNEKIFFGILIKIIEEFNIPIFLKLSNNSFQNEIIFDFIDNICNGTSFNKKLIVFIFSSENLDSQKFLIICERILKKGYSFIYSIYDCDLVVAQRNIINNATDEDLNRISSYFNQDKLEFICNLINLESKKYINQIMISNNINFRIQLKKYGGFGYTNIFKNYYQKIVKKTGLNEEEIEIIFKDNILNLLSWWEPPKKTMKKIKTFICSK